MRVRLTHPYILANDVHIKMSYLHSRWSVVFATQTLWRIHDRPLRKCSRCFANHGTLWQVELLLVSRRLTVLVWEQMMLHPEGWAGASLRSVFTGGLLQVEDIATKRSLLLTLCRGTRQRVKFTDNQHVSRIGLFLLPLAVCCDSCCSF